MKRREGAQNSFHGASPTPIVCGGAVAYNHLKKRVMVLHHEVLKDPLVGETWLGTYAFAWTMNTSCVAFGYGSLYNHNVDYNLDYKCIGEPQSMQFMTARKVKAGEELFIRYFAPGNDHFESNWIERSAEERWQEAEQKYEELSKLEPDQRLVRLPSEYIQSRKKNRIGTLKSMSTICKKN